MCVCVCFAHEEARGQELVLSFHFHESSTDQTQVTRLVRQVHSFIFLVFFETGSHLVAVAGLELIM